MKNKYMIYVFIVIILGVGSYFSFSRFNLYTRNTGTNRIGKEDPLGKRTKKIKKENSLKKDAKNKENIKATKEEYNPTFPYYVMVNRKMNTVTIYSSTNKKTYNNPYKVFICSTGKNDGDTPLGDFKTSNKYEWRTLFKNTYGQYATRITGNILFHSIPYKEKKNDTLETEEYNKLGEKASLGCIRLRVIDAKWIYDNLPEGTSVTIYDSDISGALGKPKVKKIKVDDDRKNFDPTDPIENNPWNN